ncbi:hypothetical protein CDD80_7417 [Ophiocordyceps camponoti-rufipedis]|uniref:Uncharacterized protein n=1 Tax=Ophiocordyceps camponoti-rufipedis TaxID=2004952 RepID=A0A2C5ZAL5_9HYPO|nr:hypothetical protein CDD80_7417 [Ophiocordyceps camponoti-rufipedis]
MKTLAAAVALVAGFAMAAPSPSTNLVPSPSGMCWFACWKEKPTCPHDLSAIRQANKYARVNIDNSPGLHRKASDDAQSPQSMTACMDPRSSNAVYMRPVVPESDLESIRMPSRGPEIDKET